MSSKQNNDVVKESIIRRLNMMPNFKLYKYRECNANNFDALENQYVWLSFACEFPDELDCTINYNFDSDIHELRKWFAINGLEWSFYHQISLWAKQPGDLTKIALNKLYKATFNGFDVLQHDVLLNVLNLYLDKENAQRVYRNLIYINEQIRKNENLFDEVIYSFKTRTIEANKVGQRQIAVLSLAENYKINSMWEMYAAKKTGFCVEYDFKKCLNDLDNNLWLSSISPVIYSEKPHCSMINVFEWFLNTCFLPPIKQNFYEVGPLDPAMQLLMKDTSYSYEKEWRLMFGNIQNRKLSFPYISAVYIGQYATKEHLERIRKICGKLNIAVYLQLMNAYSSNYIYQQLI